jgi:hypothetical protein
MEAWNCRDAIMRAILSHTARSYRTQACVACCSKKHGHFSATFSAMLWRLQLISTRVSGKVHKLKCGVGIRKQIRVSRVEV